MSIPQHVTKAHATGNDFVVYLDPHGEFEPTPEEVRLVCDRHFGIGADGLIRLAHPEDVSDLDESSAAESRAEGAEWFMDYRNADGSLAEMCGNGTRAVTLFARDRDLFESGSFALGTRAGVKTLTYLGSQAPYGRHVLRVDMGGWSKGDAGAYEVRLPGGEGTAPGTFVDMGNPHVVAIVAAGDEVDVNAVPALKQALEASSLPDVEKLDLTRAPLVSPALEHGQNVEFVRVDALEGAEDGAGRATMRVHERGCGETLSCGTGLCATAIALRAHTGQGRWDIAVRGGTLRVEVTDRSVSLTGAATLVADVRLRDQA